MSSLLPYALGFLVPKQPIWLGVILVIPLLILPALNCYILKHVIQKNSQIILEKFNTSYKKQDIVDQITYQLTIGALSSSFFIGLNVSAFLISKSQTGVAAILGYEQIGMLMLGIVMYTNSFKPLLAQQIQIDYVFKDLIYYSLTLLVIIVFYSLYNFSWVLGTVLISLYATFLLVQIFYQEIRKLVFSLLELDTNQKCNVQDQLHQLNRYPNPEQLLDYFQPQKFQFKMNEVMENSLKIANPKQRKNYFNLSQLYHKIVICHKNQSEHQKDRLAFFHSKQFGRGDRPEKLKLRKNYQRRGIQEPKAKKRNQDQVSIRRTNYAIERFNQLFDSLFCWMYWIQTIKPQTAIWIAIAICFGLGFSCDLLISVISNSLNVSQTFLALIPAALNSMGIILNSNLSMGLVTYLTTMQHIQLFRLGGVVSVLFLISSLTSSSDNYMNFNAGQIIVFGSISLVSGVLLTLIVLYRNEWSFLINVACSCAILAMTVYSLSTSSFFK